MKSLTLKLMFCLGVSSIASTYLVSEAIAQSVRPVAKEILNATQTVDFQPIAPFTVTQEMPTVVKGDAPKSANKATFAVLPDAEISRLYARDLAAMHLSVPFQNQLIAVDVVQVEALSSDFSLTDQNGKPLPFKAGRFYRGIVSNDPNTTVSINLFENEINGIIATPEQGNINFGKWVFDQNVQDYIIYSDKDFVHTPFQCGTETPKRLRARNPSSSECESCPRQ